MQPVSSEMQGGQCFVIATKLIITSTGIYLRMIQSLTELFPLFVFE